MRLLLVSIALQGVLAAPADDLKTVAQLRRVDLAKSSLPASNVPDLAGYVSTQNDNGTWDDVDYTAGCDGREYPLRSLLIGLNATAGRLRRTGQRSMRWQALGLEPTRASPRITPTRQ